MDAKLRNFTLESDNLYLIAYLNNDGKPVFDLCAKESGTNLITAAPADKIEATATMIMDEVYDLCQRYSSTSLVQRLVTDCSKEE